MRSCCSRQTGFRWKTQLSGCVLSASQDEASVLLCAVWCLWESEIHMSSFVAAPAPPVEIRQVCVHTKSVRLLKSFGTSLFTINSRFSETSHTTGYINLGIHWMAAGGVQRLTTDGELKVDLQKEKIPILHVDNIILSAKLRSKFSIFFALH